MQWNSNSGKFSLELPLELVLPCTMPGDNSRATAELASRPEIAEQLDKIKPEDLRAELRETGAWSDHELADHGWNRLRMLWLACHDVFEEATRGTEYSDGRGD